MLQFYFLTILLNTVTGLVLMYVNSEAGDEAEPGGEGGLTALVKDDTFRLILGILSCVTGFFKLLTTIRGDVPVVGDLLPALAGLAGGFTLLYDFYKTRSNIDPDQLPRFIQVIVSSKRYVGMACLIAAGLHFLFPTVLFL